MGGFYNSIAKIATEGLEKAGSNIAAKFPKFAGAAPFAHEAAEATEKGLYHAIFPQKAAFQDIPVAKKLYDIYAGPYKELVNKNTSHGIQQAQILGTGQPAHEIARKAEQDAQDTVFGKNRVAIQGVLKHVEKTVSKNRADILADHLNIMFREAPDSQGLSRFDRDMRKTIGSEYDGFDTPPSKYRGPGFGEKNILRTKNAMLAYKAAIPHLASNLNILLSDGFQNYAKVLATNFGPGRKAAEATVLATNAISELWYNGYREKLAFDNGVIKKYAPGGVGEFIHKNMYIPGMSRVRYETLLMSAHASKLAADEAAQHLIRGNDKMAIPMLHELGLDPVKIKAQNGILLQDDIDKAYYHGTDARAFLNQQDNRTALSQRSTIYRVMGSFHNYVSSQSRFLKQTFRRQFAQGDYIGIARNIGLLSMAFPVLGASIYESERLLAGNDWDDPVKHWENRVEATPAGQVFDKISGKENPASAARTALNTIDNLSHLASWGVATGYIRGAARNNLAGQLIGPVPNMVVQGAQDFGKALHKDVNHPDAAEPLERDIMSDVLPYGIGSIASHKLLPTKAEQSINKPKRFRMRRKVKPDSNNPMNANDFKY